MAKKLTTEQQIYIVQCFACFKTPAEVATAVREKFDLAEEPSRSTVQWYDPTFNKEIPEKWKALFDETRKGFLRAVSRVGVSHQAYRLEKLQHVLDHAGSNQILVLKVLEQAAKEMGGMYTNRLSLRVEDSRKKLAELLNLPPEQLPSDLDRA